MEHFAQLPEASVRVKLPEPVRLRVMEELESDASALLDHFRGRGMTEEAAAREVEAWLGTPPEVWRELEEIHRPIAVRWADRLLEPQRHRVERVVLLVAALSLAAAAIPLRGGLIVQAPFGTGWLVLAMACAILVIALQWFVQRWRASAKGIRLAESLAVLALGTPAVGLLGAGLTLSRVSGRGMAPWNAIEIASGITTVGVMAGIAAGVLWSVHRASDRLHSRRSDGGV